jgi:uncharacterized protein YndB with AHSA1/START domain
LEESINLSAWLGCTVNRAFEMFTDKDHIQSWLPLITDVEPKAGGKFEISVEFRSKNKKKAGKKKSRVRCKIFAFELNKFLAFEWIGPTGNSNNEFNDIHPQVSVHFLPMDTSKKNQMEFTEVSLTLTWLDESTEDSEAKKWYQSSWTDAFERLIEYVNDIMD